jgi:hypothetical protein
LAIAEARETGQGITENSLLEVHASSYINTFNVEKHTAYTVLRDASRSLFDRYVTYHDINPKTGKRTVSTVDGWIKLVMNINQGLYSYVSLKILSL